MPIRTTKLYPTPEHCQRDTDGATGAPIDRVQWWADHLLTLLAALPIDERASARLRFTDAGPEVWYDRQIDQADIDRERYLLLLADLERRATNAEAQSAEDARALLMRVRQVV